MGELTAIPASLDAGTACTIRRTLDDYPASDGWIVTLHLQGPSSAHIASEADTEVVDDHLLTLTATITAALESGSYRYLETVSRGEGEAAEDPVTVSRGRLYVRPDLINATDGSLQDPDEAILAIIDAALAGRITHDVAAYQLEQLGVTREDIKDLVALQAKYRRRLYRKHHRGMFAGTATVSLRRPSSNAPARTEYDE